MTCPLRYVQLLARFTGKSFEISAEKAGIQAYGAKRFAIGNKPVPPSFRMAIMTPQTVLIWQRA